VAQLNADMWGELCIANSKYLVKELDGLIGTLSLYRQALADKDTELLVELLEDGSRIKKELDS
jgi:prephenate dehydrogenase